VTLEPPELAARKGATKAGTNPQTGDSPDEPKPAKKD
jgi:hypothetical protein